MSKTMKLAADFNRYFTSSNGIDVPERVSVSRDEWRQLHAALQSEQPDSPWTENVAVKLAASRTGRVYIAGPMTGIAEFNFPAFNKEAVRLRAEGLTVLNPADHGIVEGAEWADYLRHDIAGLATCQRIHLLPGWEKSKGARLEVTIAQALGMAITLADGAASPAAQATQATDYVGVEPDGIVVGFHEGNALVDHAGSLEEGDCLFLSPTIPTQATQAEVTDAVAYAIHQVIKPSNMTDADWHSGAMLGHENEYREKVEQAATRAILAMRPAQVAAPMSEIDIEDDDSLRFVQRVLESDAPKEDRQSARDMVVGLRKRVRKAHHGITAQAKKEGG